MELNEIKKILDENFNKELKNGKRRNIVFWYDEDKEFESEIDELNLENAKLLKVNESNNFFIKYQLEKIDTENNYLIYVPFAKPNPRDNWLIDILKYSVEFTTDKATVIMREFNITDDSLRYIFRNYIKFFNNKERYRLFKSYEIQHYEKEIIDIAVLSALCKLTYSDFEGVLKSLLAETIDGENKNIEAIEKFGDIDALWGLIEKYYGYSLEDKSVENLGIFLMLTNLSFTLGEKIPDSWNKYISPKKADCVVFLSNFMNNALYSKTYDVLADKIEKIIKIQDYIDKWDIDNYKNCDIFRAFDKSIINKINSQLLSDIGEFEKYKEIVLSRRTKHWYSLFSNEYDCIYWAIVFFGLWSKVEKDIKELSSFEFFNKYKEEYCLIDTAYRKFYNAFDNLENKEWLTELKEKIENAYVNAYFNTLSIKWSSSISGLNEYWNIPGLTSQREFYKTFIKPHMNKGERVFVIISDALRFEAGKEFMNILNTDRKGSTEIFAIQGSIPSYTKLGMASLLPNKSISISEKYSVLVDDINSEGTENREKILKNYEDTSMAITYDKIVDMKRDDFRKTFAGKNLIYIYHNNIDARGDNSKTEREVFNAVEETFSELRILINNLVNNLTATNIYITADHGFIYKRGNITEFDKVLKEDNPEAFENRRFILSNNDEKMEGTLSFNMSYILGDNTDLKCITPRGFGRFRIQGPGANYVHGGTSLQEIVVPVIKFKNDRSKLAKTDVKKVDVKLTSISRKITNTITYFEFFQTEKIEDKIIPIRLKLYFADEEGNKVSNENIIIADIKKAEAEDRIFKEKFVLKNMKYDKNKKYYLVLEDEEEMVEKVIEKIAFTIDIAFSNDDFGF